MAAPQFLTCNYDGVEPQLIENVDFKNIPNTALTQCLTGGCVHAGLDTKAWVASQPDAFCNESLAAQGHAPSEFGCADWESCHWTISGDIAMGSGQHGIGCDNGDIKTCASGQVGYDVYPIVTSATCVRVGHNPAFRQACCFGTQENPDTFCDATWCPSDPAGACTDLFLEHCSGASECGRHKFLTGSITESMEGAPCNLWYNNITNYAENGYATYGQSITQTLNSILSATAEIDRYCRNEGATAGECSCYLATQQCKQGDPLSPGCLIAGTGGGGSATPGTAVRRTDLYCNGSHSEVLFDWKTGAVTSISYDGLCSPNVDYSSPTLNGGSNPWDPSKNPDQPPGGLGPFPAHCWIPACQGNGVACMFKDLVDLARPCPPICMQFASGGNVYIDGTTTPYIKVDVNQINCGGWGPSAAALSPFAWPASLMSVDVPVGAVGSFSVPLTNLSIDRAASFSSVPTQLYASFAPITNVTFVSGSDGVPPDASIPGAFALPNSATSDVWFTVDTGGLFEGQFYNGMLAATDASQANAPGLLFFDLAIGGPSDSASFDWGGGTQRFPTTPSARKPQSQQSKQSEQSEKSQHHAPRGAYGQTRIPSSIHIRQGVAAANAARIARMQSAQHTQNSLDWWIVGLLIFVMLAVAVVFFLRFFSSSLKPSSVKPSLSKPIRVSS